MMIGWFFLISTKTREERVRDPDERASVLASWEAGVEGLDWIEDLVAKGVARKLAGGGYPNVYTVRAGDVLPLLKDGPPRVSRGVAIIGDDYVTPAGWQDKVQLHVDRMAACSADAQLTIEAWDLS